MDAVRGRAKVYVETSVPSHLTDWPDGDPATVARRRITREWWAVAGSLCDLFVSDTVLWEISRGDPVAAAERLGRVRHLPVLALDKEVRRVARRYRRDLGLPVAAKADILHIAFAVAYRMDVLVTWNCAHMANEVVAGRLEVLNVRQRLWMPRLVTPETLLQEGKA